MYIHIILTDRAPTISSNKICHRQTSHSRSVLCHWPAGPGAYTSNTRDSVLEEGQEGRCFDGGMLRRQRWGASFEHFLQAFMPSMRWVPILPTDSCCCCCCHPITDSRPSLIFYVTFFSVPNHSCSCKSVHFPKVYPAGWIVRQRSSYQQPPVIK